MKRPQYLMKRFQIFLSVLLLCLPIYGQTTEFTYQGRLADNSLPASGTYEMRFRVFDSEAGGTQMPVATPITLDFTVANGNAVTVTNGSFTVRLDFSAAAFPGSPRFLEVSVRRNAGDPFTPLNPRQPITSVPHNIKSRMADSLSTSCVLCVTDAQIQSIDGSKVTGTVDSAASAANAATANNASQLGGVAANQYVQTGDSRLSDARTPLSGSANYIQANPTTPQPATSFNIGADGTLGGRLSAGIVNSATRYELGGMPVFNVSGSFSDSQLNFAGTNTFVGERAGMNSAPNPAPNNSLGKWNSFFGAGTGEANVQGSSNAFFGFLAGAANFSGSSNSFFGAQAGRSTTDGILNTFIGVNAGYRNKDQSTNTFVGAFADFSSDNPIGNGNTLLGIGAKVDSGVNNGTAIGGRAIVTQSNSLILGGIGGVNGGTDTNVGIGTTSPSQRLHVVGNGLFTGDLTVNGTLNATLPSNSGNYIQNTTTQQASSNFNISGNGIVGGNLGIGVTSPAHPLHVNGNGLFTGNLTFQLPNWSGRLSGLSTEANNTLINFGINNGRQGPFDESMNGYWIRTDNRPGFQGIHFFKKAHTTGTESQLMAINEFGNIGIGTAIPVGNLHVSSPGAQTPVRALTVDVGSFGTTGNAINSYYFKARDVGSGSASAFIVRGDGNVGIGTDAPSARLTVAGDVRLDGALSVNGSQGQAGQVLTSAGTGTAPQWTSPTNSLYQRTSMSTSTGTISPGFTPEEIPGLFQTITVVGDAKLLIQFEVAAFTGSCIGCGAREANLTVFHNGTAVYRTRDAVGGEAGSAHLTGFYLLSVGAGNHSISIGASTSNLTPAQVNFGCNTQCNSNAKSNLLVQVIPM
jgi:hypothetical protein